VRVLITGAAGRIGSVLSAGLEGSHDVRGLDLQAPERNFAAGFVEGDCADPDVAARAVDGMDAVVHLAGVPTESDLPTILHGHVETTAALLDAMVEGGVGRMLYASSNHAVGMIPRTELVGVDVPTRPDTFYGVGKVAAEALLSMYADRYHITAVAMRIGSFLPAPRTRRHLATWLSHDDCVRMVHATLTADVQGFSVIYGISANADAWWDLAPGRALGYEPADDAASVLSPVPDRPEDEVECGYLGGDYVFRSFDHRPFAGQGEAESSS
jgi:uronate dehydrogenase